MGTNYIGVKGSTDTLGFLASKLRFPLVGVDGIVNNFRTAGDTELRSFNLTDYHGCSFDL
jgi:hypothetical protein